MIESLMSAWVFFVGGMLAVICFVAGFLTGSRFFRVTKDVDKLLQSIRFKINTLQRKIDDQT